MYKSIIFFALLAFAAAAPAPKPGAILAYSAPAVVSSVVHPGVSSYSAYSNSVVHGSPVVPVVPVVHQPLVHSLPLAYSAPVHTVLI